MPTNLNQKSPELTHEEFEQFWGLHEPLRLPIGQAGWEAFEPSSIMDELRVRSHANNYASIVGITSKEETLRRVARLIAEFPLDFKAAEDSISPEGWRTLYYSGSYVLGNLAAYNFHADQELRHICEFDEFTEGLPAIWIGSDVEPRVIAHRTREILDGLGSEPSKAVYCVLAAAQRISLSRSEALGCKWWTAAWVQNLSAKLSASQ